MRIAVNARTLDKNSPDGVGRFTFETMHQVVTKHTEHQFYFLFDRPVPKEYSYGSNVVPIHVPFGAHGPFMWRYWFDYRVPTILKQVQADVFLSTDGLLSLATNVPQHLVIHDLCFVHNPQELSWRRRWYYQNVFVKFPSKAKRIATVSEYSRQDISKTFNVNERDIDVVYNGISSVFTPLSEAEKTIIKTKYTNGCDFFVFVGSLVQSRKNLSRLLKAFDKFKNYARSDFKLVIVGNTSLMSREVKDTIGDMDHGADISFTGQVGLQELRNIVGSAFALTYVPYFEGFGLPILEALSCGVPVITSETTSLPEVGGDAAMYVDPFSIDSIKNAMVFIYESEELRERLLEKGLMQCRKFTWERTADRYWGSVSKFLETI
jgi:glycosyltransferase involved in cell wall biosynthesis